MASGFREKGEPHGCASGDPAVNIYAKTTKIHFARKHTLSPHFWARARATKRTTHDGEQIRTEAASERRAAGTAGSCPRGAPRSSRQSLPPSPTHFLSHSLSFSPLAFFSLPRSHFPPALVALPLSLFFSLLSLSLSGGRPALVAPLASRLSRARCA